MSGNMEGRDGEMSTICLEFEFTEADYTKALEKYLEATGYMVWLAPLTWFFFLVMFMAFGDLGLFPAVGELSWPIRALILVSFVLLAVFFRRRARAARFVRRALRSGTMDSRMFGLQRLELKENCIEQQCQGSCIRRSYTDIQKIVEYPGGMMLYDQASQLIIIPSTAFDNTQRQAEFLQHVQYRVNRPSNAELPEQIPAGLEQDTDYTLQYTWDETGFVAAMTKAKRLMFTTRLGWPPRQVIFVLAGLFLIFAGLWHLLAVSVEADGIIYIHSYLPGIFSLAAGVGLFGNLILVFTPAIKRVTGMLIERGVYSRDYFDLQFVGFSADKITEHRRRNRFDFQYSSVHCVKYDSECVYLLLKGQRVLSIPNVAFSSQDQKLELVGYINKKIGHAT